jgi:hypothetical protein
MAWSNRTPGEFTILTRGTRGTVAVGHLPGGGKKGTVESVRCGYTIERIIEIPSYREAWNFR